jgi:hypothetical protein
MDGRINGTFEARRAGVAGALSGTAELGMASGVQSIMNRGIAAAFVLIIALGHVGATTRPAVDPARQTAAAISRFLRNAHVRAVEFRVNERAESAVRVEDPKEVAELGASLRSALAAGDLHEGKQRHRPTRNVYIRFVVAEGADVRFNFVGMDMFWAAMSDEEPEWKPAWTNLQTAALTRCFAGYVARVTAATRPSR